MCIRGSSMPSTSQGATHLNAFTSASGTQPCLPLTGSYTPRCAHSSVRGSVSSGTGRAKKLPSQQCQGLSPACHSPGAVGGGSQGPGIPPQHESHPTAGGAPPAPLLQSLQAGPPRATPASSKGTAIRCHAAAMMRSPHATTIKLSGAAWLPSPDECMEPQDLAQIKIRC